MGTPVNVERDEAVVVYDDTESLTKLIANAEKHAELINKVRVACMRVTRESDWVLMRARNGLKPYLQGTGAEAVARAFRVSIRNVIQNRIEGEDRNGNPWYGYEMMAEFSLPDGASILALGSRQSNEDFFAKQPTEPPDRDIRMAAYTNLIVNGITRLLGIRNITTEELIAAGLNPDKMQGIDYKQDGKPSAQASGQKEQATDEDKAKLLGYLRMVAGADKTALADLLQQVTAFGDYQGRRTLKGQMSKSQCMRTIGKLKELMDSGELVVSFDEKGEPLPEDGDE